MSNTKLKIGYFSPMEPVRSGISVYSRELVKELSKEFELTVVTNGYLPEKKISGVKMVDIQEVKNVEDFMEGFDQVLYHLGNNENHIYIYEMALDYPGIIVLHDYSIHDMLVASTLKKGDFEKYKSEVEACGVYFEGQTAVPLEKNHEPIKFMWAEKFLEYPMNERVITNSDLTVMHSEFARSLTMKRMPLSKVVTIPLFVNEFEEFSESDSDEIVIGTFGLVEPHKRLETLISVVGELVEDSKKKVKLLVVGGFSSEEYRKKLEKLIDEAGIESCTEITGFVDEDEYFEKLSETQVCVNLRYPTLGETSISVMQILGRSKPCIVTDIGWFKELPSDCVRKIPVPENGEKKYLKYALEELVSDYDERKKMGKSACEYAKNVHGIDKVAKQYAETIISSIWYKKARDAQLKKLAEVMDEFHLNADDKNIVSMLANNIKDVV